MISTVRNASVLVTMMVFSAIVFADPAASEHRDVIALVPENWPPQYQTDSEGNPTGFAIDVMNEIAELGHFSVTYKQYPNFSVVVDALIAGEGDLIPNSGILADRFDEFAFTSPVETFNVRVFVRDEESQISGYDDLSGKAVAVVEKNVGLFLLKDRDDIALHIQRDLQDAILALISGNVDALVYPGSVALAMARNAKIDHRIQAVGEPIREVKRGIRVRIEDFDLRDELEPLVQSFVKSDRYAELYAKWYGRPAPLLSTTELWILLIVSLAVVVIVFAVWRHASLRALNRELRSENEQQNAQLRQNEQLLETAGRTAKLGGWQLDIQTGKVRWTEAVYRIHDLPLDTRPEELESALSYYPPQDRKKVELAVQQAIEHGIPYDIETRFVSAKGRQQWVRSICQPEVIDGVVQRLHGTFQDITDVKESEQQLLKAKKEADQLVSEKETLVQEVHHRVKNNLQVILSMLSLQARAALNDHEAIVLSESSRRVRVMGKLYEHLYQSENVSEIDPKEYFSDVLNDSMSSSGASEGIKTSLHCDAVSLKIKAATALAQILSELISNCIKHAFPEGSGSIQVSLVKEDNGVLRLIIEDDGIGLPKGFDEKKLKSMSIKLVNALVNQLHGEKNMISNEGIRAEISFKEGT